MDSNVVLPTPGARPRLFRVGVLISVWVGVGCVEHGAPPISTSVRDSAGIRIVENPPDAVASAPEWVLSPTPMVRIGALDGEEEYQLHRVRGAVLHQNRIWVLDGGSSEIRAFDLDGSHFLSTGRNGEGPGEFNFPTHLDALDPDTLLVWDQSLRRVSYFNSHGTFVRSVTIPSNLLQPTFLSALDEESFLLYSAIVAFPSTNQVEVTPLSVIRVDPERRTTDTIAEFPHLRVKRVDQPIDLQLMIFSPLTWVDGDRRTFWVGTGEEWEFQQRDSHGGIVQIVRWHGNDRRVLSSHVDAYFARMVENAETEDRVRQIQQSREQVPIADQFPTHADIVVDRIGRIWLRQYAPPTEDGPYEWVVFSERGEILATMRIPRDFRPQEFGEDYVLGVTRGEFDEEYVVLFEIQQAEIGT